MQVNSLAAKFLVMYHITDTVLRLEILITYSKACGKIKHASVNVNVFLGLILILPLKSKR